MFLPVPAVKTGDAVGREADGLQMHWLQSHHSMFASCGTSALLFLVPK